MEPLARRIEKSFDAIYLDTKVTGMAEEEQGIRVHLVGPEVEERERVFEKVLVAVGRRRNSGDLGLENTRVERDDRGFIRVNAQRRTAEPSTSL